MTMNGDGIAIVRRAQDVLQRYASSTHGTRSFCSRCGSTLFCESTHHPDRVDVVLANVKGTIDRAPAPLA